MTAQHTPGPWVVGPVDDTVVTHLGADGRRYEVAAVEGDYNDPDQWPVMEANARLIAAAPDLLEAAKQALWHIGSDDDRLAMADADKWKTDEWQAAGLLRAAIAKATGADQ